jgi:tRNA G10  N-methylase Trm11
MEGSWGFTVWGTRTNLETYHIEEVRVSFLTSVRKVEYEESNYLNNIVYYACYLKKKL